MNHIKFCLQKFNFTAFIVLVGMGLNSSKLYSAEIEETVLGMNVSGNKEAPNLLYIIPWKESSEQASPPEIFRLMDEVYSTVDPDVFEKEVIFFDQLQTEKIIIPKEDEL